jgi:hypothetical protein
VPDKRYSNSIEFRVSEDLYADVHRLSQEHGLSHKEFAIASIGLLNQAHHNRFHPDRTQLVASNGERLPLPSIKTPSSETHWPRIIRASLMPHLYDPIAVYAHEDLPRIQDRGRQAFRFGVFVLQHSSPLEDDAVMFWNYNQQHTVEELVGLTFRTQQ